jgi:hypothetical protein
VENLRSKFIQSFTVGVRRRWKIGIAQALGVMGAIWLVTELVTKVMKSVDEWIVQHGDIYLAVVGAASLIWFLRHTYEARTVSFVVPTTDFRINIKFGNLLAQQTDWLIGVNEFFDSEIGHIVAQESLHGKFISEVFNGDCTVFRQAVDSALSNMPSTQSERTFSPSARYEIGTTAVIARGKHKAFLMALSRTNLVTAKASCDVPTLWTALAGALQSVHHYGNGAPLSMPLIGNGRSSVNLEPQHLLRLIVLGLVDFGRKVGLPREVNIILPEACFESIDIREIRRDWEKK